MKTLSALLALLSHRFNNIHLIEVLFVVFFWYLIGHHCEWGDFSQGFPPDLLLVGYFHSRQPTWSVRAVRPSGDNHLVDSPGDNKSRVIPPPKKFLATIISKWIFCEGPSTQMFLLLSDSSYFLYWAQQTWWDIWRLPQSGYHYHIARRPAANIQILSLLPWSSTREPILESILTAWLEKLSLFATNTQQWTFSGEIYIGPRLYLQIEGGNPLAAPTLSRGAPPGSQSSTVLWQYNSRNLVYLLRILICFFQKEHLLVGDCEYLKRRWSTSPALGFSQNTHILTHTQSITSHQSSNPPNFAYRFAPCQTISQL